MRDSLKLKFRPIVTEAIESQMDWEAYYSGDREDVVEELLSLVDTEFEDYKQSLIKWLEGEKRKPTVVEIGCPDKILGCAVFHSKEVFHLHDKDFNDAIDKVINHLKNNNEN